VLENRTAEGITAVFMVLPAFLRRRDRTRIPRFDTLRAERLFG